MKEVPDTAHLLDELPPLPALLTAYSSRSERRWQAMCWRLDQRLAAIVRRGGDPMIAAIRLAWWDEVLVEGDPGKGRGEPLVETWRAMAPTDAAALAADLIDGWRALLAPEIPNSDDLRHFGEKRGGGLFALIAAGSAMPPSGALAQAGAVWALWDLAGNSRDAALSDAAMREAKAALAAMPPLMRPGASRPLRLLFALAAADARAGRTPKGFEGRHYRALLWRALLP